MSSNIRTFWVRVFFPNSVTSDAFPIELNDEESLILDLKKKILKEVSESTSVPIKLPWISLHLGDKEGDESSKMDEKDGDVLLASMSLSDLPDGAGGKEWHIFAKVKFLDDLIQSNAVKKPTVKEEKKEEDKTLFDKGIAGFFEPDHIKNAKNLEELYPGGILPRGAPNDFNPQMASKLCTVLLVVITFSWLLTTILKSIPFGSPQEGISSV